MKLYFIHSNEPDMIKEHIFRNFNVRIDYSKMSLLSCFIVLLVTISLIHYTTSK